MSLLYQGCNKIEDSLRFCPDKVTSGTKDFSCDLEDYEKEKKYRKDIVHLVIHELLIRKLYVLYTGSQKELIMTVFMSPGSR